MKWGEIDSESFEAVDIGSEPEWDGIRQKYKDFVDWFIDTVKDLFGYSLVRHEGNLDAHDQGIEALAIPMQDFFAAGPMHQDLGAHSWRTTENRPDPSSSRLRSLTKNATCYSTPTGRVSP